MIKKKSFSYENLSATLEFKIPDAMGTLNPPKTQSELREWLDGLGVTEDFGLATLYEWRNGQKRGEPGLLFGMRLLSLEDIGPAFERMSDMPIGIDQNGVLKIPLFCDSGGNHIVVVLLDGDGPQLGRVFVTGRGYASDLPISDSLRALMKWFCGCLEENNFDYIDHGHGFGELNLKTPPSTHLLDVIEQLPLPLTDETPRVERQ